MFIDFKKQTALGKNLLDWWRSLDMVELRPPGTAPSAAEADAGDDPDDPLLGRGDRAGRAMLRRADSLAAVVMTPVYQRLYQRLCRAGWPADDDWRNDRLAAVAGLLAHVAADDDRPLPLAMSRKRKDEQETAAAAGDDRPPVSPLRFKRLLESPDVDTLFAGLRRTLPLLAQGGAVRVDVRGLATDVVNWGDRVKKRWAYGYEAWDDKPDG